MRLHSRASIIVIPRTVHNLAADLANAFAQCPPWVSRCIHSQHALPRRGIQTPHCILPHLRQRLPPGLQPTGTIGTIQARLAAGWLGHLFDCYGLPPDEVIARDGGVWLIRRLSWPVFQATLSALELLANPPATPERSAAGADAAHPALAVATEAIGKNPKRSTSPGGATKKLISALTKHHKFANGGCLNLEPIGNNELARLADVDKSTASEFFTAKFQGHDKYKWLCRNDAAGLVAALKLLNGEFAPHLLYGSKPDERDRDAP